MRAGRLGVAVIVVATSSIAAVVAGCLSTGADAPGSSSDAGGENVCTPGVSVSCQCGDGSNGSRPCKDDGSFASCTCDGGSSPGDSGSSACGQPGACTDGLCFPDGCRAITTLVSMPYEATKKIVLTNDKVFFIALLETAGGFSSSVLSVPKTGGPTTNHSVRTGAGLDALGDFATDGTSVFVSIIQENIGGSPKGVYRCDSSCTPLSSDTHASSLSARGDYLYWVDSPGGDILRCAKAGCGNAPDIVATGPSGAAAAGRNLITTDASNVYVAYSSGTLGSAPLDVGGSVTTLGIGTTPFVDLVVDAANVYAADTNGAVLRCAKTGCPGGVSSIANTRGARSLTTDGTTLLWLGDPRGTVWAAPVNGSSATAIFAVPDGFERSPAPARALAVDATYLYFGGQGLFRVKR